MTPTALSATIIGSCLALFWGSVNTQYKIGVMFSFINGTLRNGPDVNFLLSKCTPSADSSQRPSLS